MMQYTPRKLIRYFVEGICCGCYVDHHVDFHVHVFVCCVKRFPKVHLVFACLFMVFRASTNILGLVVSSKNFDDFGRFGNGIFIQLLSWVISSSNKVGDGLLSSQIPLWTAFEGRGGSRQRKYMKLSERNPMFTLAAGEDAHKK